jgi:hypothetical protein
VKLSSEQERLLATARGLLQAKLSNPNNGYNAEGLMKSCIKEAQMLIQLVSEVKEDESTT